MAINSIAMRAYDNAAKIGENVAKPGSLPKVKNEPPSFLDTVKESVVKVNDEQSKKVKMIESFASGEEQNVHELMIQLQKAGLAMNMTSAVRNKVMEAYKSLMQMPF